jgi:VCBS repeat-containing protein
MTNYVVTFTVAVTDTGGLTDTAALTISVSADNDAPVASDDSASTDEDTDALGTISASDPDTDDDLSYGVTAPPVYGSASINGATGVWTYTPANRMTNYVVTFTVAVTDTGGLTDTAALTISVSADNDVPVVSDDSASTDEDTDAWGTISASDPDTDDTLSYGVTTPPVYGSASINKDTGAWTYTPANRVTGYVATFTVVVTDTGDLIDTALVSISVAADNDVPVADDDAFAVDEDSISNSLDVLDGDTDADSDVLTVSAVGIPDSGGVATSGGTDIIYTPATDFFGAETFTYTVGDGNGGYDTATVVVTVNNLNDAPIAVGDAYTTSVDMPLTVAAPGVLANDSDVDGDSLTAHRDDGPTDGTLTLHIDGSFIYTPTSGFDGVVSFTYHAHDGTTDSNVVTVEIVVSKPSDHTVYLPLALRDYSARAFQQ